MQTFTTDVDQVRQLAWTLAQASAADQLDVTGEYVWAFPADDKFDAVRARSRSIFSSGNSIKDPTVIDFVQELNTIVDKVNNGFDKDKPILKRLDKEVHPRADKLGTIKHTITSIFERIKEIDTWAIILVCLFIDLLVPLAIYLLLRKSDSDSDTPEQKLNRPTNFNRTY